MAASRMTWINAALVQPGGAARRGVARVTEESRGLRKKSRAALGERPDVARLDGPGRMMLEGSSPTRPSAREARRRPGAARPHPDKCSRRPRADVGELTKPIHPMAPNSRSADPRAGAHWGAWGL